MQDAVQHPAFSFYQEKSKIIVCFIIAFQNILCWICSKNFPVWKKVNNYQFFTILFGCGSFFSCEILKCKRAKQKAQIYFLLHFSRRRQAMKLSKLFFHTRKLHGEWYWMNWKTKYWLHCKWKLQKSLHFSWLFLKYINISFLSFPACF